MSNHPRLVDDLLSSKTSNFNVITAQLYEKGLFRGISFLPAEYYKTNEVR